MQTLKGNLPWLVFRWSKMEQKGKYICLPYCNNGVGVIQDQRRVDWGVLHVTPLLMKRVWLQPGAERGGAMPGRTGRHRGPCHWLMGLGTHQAEMRFVQRGMDLRCSCKCHLLRRCLLDFDHFTRMLGNLISEIFFFYGVPIWFSLLDLTVLFLTCHLINNRIKFKKCHHKTFLIFFLIVL